MKKFLSSILGISMLLSLAVVPVASANEGSTNTTTYDGACMQTAVDTRDTAIVAAWSTYSNSVQTALSTRKDALKAAWGLSDKTARKNAIKTAWKNYKDSLTAARKALKESRNTAWAKFKTDSKACKVTPSNSGDTTSPSADGSL